MIDETRVEHDFDTFEAGQQRDAIAPILSTYGIVKDDVYVGVVDPFKTGTDLDIERAEQFMVLYDLAGGDSYAGHLRDLHYTVNALRPDLYDASDDSWLKLMAGKKLAVNLGVLRPDALDDRSISRSMDAQRDGVTMSPGSSEISVLDHEVSSFSAPSMATVRPATMLPIDLMLWVEKPSPMIEAEIEPVCVRYGVDVRYGSGAPGQTFVGHRARQAADRDREFVLLALSDADFSGATMARSLAKNLEVIYRGRLIDDVPRLRVVRCDFTIDRVEQIEHELGRKVPRTVDGKTGDERIELQALPAFVPGELGRIVEDAIISVVGYFEESLEDWVSDLDTELAESSAAAGLKKVERDYEKLLKSPEYIKVRGRLESLADLREEHIETLLGIVDDADRPEIDEPDTDWLLDTDRSYIEQVQAYRRHEGQTPLVFERRVCASCGGPVTGDRRRKHCDDACAQRAKHMKANDLPFLLPERSCLICGTPFQPKRKDSFCCCPEHRAQFKTLKRARLRKGIEPTNGAA